jgi:hypothetical protein
VKVLEEDPKKSKVKKVTQNNFLNRVAKSNVVKMIDG